MNNDLDVFVVKTLKGLRPAQLSDIIECLLWVVYG